jgi:hypothetical protein
MRLATPLALALALASFPVHGRAGDELTPEDTARLAALGAALPAPPDRFKATESSRGFAGDRNGATSLFRGVKFEGAEGEVLRIHIADCGPLALAACREKWALKEDESQPSKAVVPLVIAGMKGEETSASHHHIMLPVRGRFLVQACGVQIARERVRAAVTQVSFGRLPQ